MEHKPKQRRLRRREAPLDIKEARALSWQQEARKRGAEIEDLPHDPPVTFLETNCLYFCAVIFF